MNDYLTRSAVILLALFMFAAAGCGGERRKVRPVIESEMVGQPAQNITRAPWEFWSNSDLGIPQLAEAERHAARGEFSQAIVKYQEAEAQAPQVLIRRLGTMLKLGQSKEVLAEAARRSAQQPFENLGAEAAFIIAFAYEHQKNIDQTFAWLSLAYRLSPPNSALSTAVRGEATRLVRRIKPAAFESYALRWPDDPFVSALLAEERARRDRGGMVLEDRAPDWFSPQTYGSTEQARPAEEPSLGAPAGGGAAVLGVLLPLSGNYAAHASRVQHGIELAAEKFDPQRTVRLIVADTKGDPQSAVLEYERLTQTERAQGVLGPLLAKSSEAVAQRSQTAQVPVLTFTKKKGIAGYSNVTFRLGATAENQADELAAYAIEQRSASSFIVASSASAPENELAAAFTQAVARRSNAKVDIVRYDDSDESLAEAIEKIERIAPQAVFVAEPLENSSRFISRLKTSAASAALLLGPASWDDPVVLQANAALLERAVYVAPFFQRSEKPLVKQFVADYSARYQSQPDLLAAQGYDGAALMIRALLDPAPRSTAMKLRSLQQVEGVTGRLDVRSDGEIARRMSVLEVRGGTPVEILSAGVPTGIEEPARNEGEEDPSER